MCDGRLDKTEPGTGRIGRSYYDETAYFDDDARLRHFGSRFQRYRVARVRELYALAPKVREVVGLDFSERAIAGCRARTDLHGFDNIVFEVGDARGSGLGAGSFDVMIAADLFEHLPGLRVLERLAQRWVPLLRRRIAVVGLKPEQA